MRVVVVGAGISGLTCGAALTDAGIDVTVHEARHRLGGRTWTADIGGAPVDLGGSWIHGPHHNPLADYCRTAGFGWHNDGNWGTGMYGYDPAGRLIDSPTASTVVAARSDFDPAQAADRLGEGATFDQAVDWYLADRNLTGAVGDAVAYNLRYLDGGLNIGAPPGQISVRGAAEYSDHGGGNLMLAGGYRTLVEHLAAPLDITLSSPVVAVEDLTGSVIVSTAAGSVRADRVIVTVPLPVLRSIMFAPGLPPTITGAMGRLRLSTVEKAVLRYDQRWWPDDLRRITWLHPDHIYPTWTDVSRSVGSPTLVGFVNPTLATALPPTPDERSAVARDVVDRLIGPGPEPVAIHTTDWANDPYSLGSYSYIPTGATAADMRAFHHRVGNVSFAGEHTVPEHFGTVHAAFMSGMRAAADLVGRPIDTVGGVPVAWPR